MKLFLFSLGILCVSINEFCIYFDGGLELTRGRENDSDLLIGIGHVLLRISLGDSLYFSSLECHLRQS
jgi:hypothetical protein